MKTAVTKCYILGHKDFGEKDKLIFMYSKDLGKIKVIAKGARRITSRFMGHLETLNHCTASLYFGPKNIILTEITLHSSFAKKTDLNKLTSALQIAEVTDKILFENQTIDNLENLIQKTIEQINKSEKTQLITAAYILKLLDLAGLIPNFKETPLKLGEKYQKFFNFVQKNSIEEIDKIKITSEESLKINRFLKEILLRELNAELKYI